MTVCFAGLFGVYLLMLYCTSNFHEVVPEKLYRSAQLSPENFSRYVEKYKIKTVLNLRGAEKASWYDKEIENSQKLKITHLDFQMDSEKELTNDQVRELLTLMQNAPKPLLIHCKHGENRTSLAAALYLAGIEKSGELKAEMQLSPIYGHWPIWFLHGYAMDRTFERAEEVFFDWT